MQKVREFKINFAATFSNIIDRGDYYIDISKYSGAYRKRKKICNGLSGHQLDFVVWKVHNSI